MKAINDVFLKKLAENLNIEELMPIINNPKDHPCLSIQNVMTELSKLFDEDIKQCNDDKDAIYGIGMELFNKTIELLEKYNDSVKIYARIYASTGDDGYWWDEFRDDALKDFVENNRRIIPPEEIYDGFHGDTQELWDFIEKYISTWNCNEIAWIDDIDKVLDDDYEEDFRERNDGFFGVSEKELLEERKRLVDIVFKDAYDNYLRKMKGETE